MANKKKVEEPKTKTKETTKTKPIDEVKEVVKDLSESKPKTKVTSYYGHSHRVKRKIISESKK